MKVIRFERFGEPAEVLQGADAPIPEPKAGEVRVRMLASPVNPSDLMFIRGRYGIVPTLPASPGFEGVGVVEQAGPGVLGKILVGRRVAVLNGTGGNWAEQVVIPAGRAVPVPKDLPIEQAASFFVNPVTVLAMVRHVLQVPKGAWLLQSAAGSSLGRMIIRLGKHDGFRTLNVVRRHEAIAEIQALGGDAVISSSDGPIADQVRKIVGAEGVRHALDPVGGATGAAVLDSLSPGGRMLVYGSLSNEPIPVSARGLIAGNTAVEGFWLGHWAADRSKLAMILMFREVARLIRDGVLATEPGRGFPLDAVADAVREAETTGRQGKVLLRIGDPNG